jgi:spore coat polysaccharide biosynthesis protein SpsF
MQKDIFIQARMGSTRLPGKVLTIIGDKPILVRTYHRIRKTALAKHVVVITSTDQKDDQIEAVCHQYNIPVFRGSELDLLDRHYKAALKFQSDYVFKIPSDCPLSDVGIIDQVIKLAEKYDYVSNYHPPSFPDGLDVEGASFKCLQLAWKNATASHEREHTFPYIWDQPNTFSIGNLENKLQNMFMTHRWTIDYQEDIDFIKTIYREFDYSDDFGFHEVLQILNKKPELMKINDKYNGVNWYRNESHNLKTIDKNQYKKEPLRLINED